MKPLHEMTKPERAALVTIARMNRGLSSLIAGLHGKQLEFILDAARNKAAITTRQSGKTHACAVYAVKECIERPGCKCVYVAKNIGQCKREFWTTVQQFSRDHSLGIVAHPGEMSLEFPNGSVIYCLGMDTSEDLKDRLRGAHFRLAIIDEAGFWQTDLYSFVRSVLGPMMWADKGTMCMISTPGYVGGWDPKKRAGDFFYGVTVAGSVPGWSVHRWTSDDNPAVSEEYQREKQQKLDDGEGNDPEFIREYLGQYVVDRKHMCYAFDDAKNRVTELPKLRPGDAWTHVMGVDFGFSDANAFVVACYNLTDPCTYVLEVSKVKGLDAIGICEHAQALYRAHDCLRMICDEQNPSLIMTMQQRYGMPAEPTKSKQRKAEFMDMLAAELRRGRVKVVGDRCEELVMELRELRWDVNALQQQHKRVEDYHCDNHACDAMLYCWRDGCREYLASDDRVPTEKSEAQKIWDRVHDRMNKRGTADEEQDANYYGELSFDRQVPKGWDED